MGVTGHHWQVNGVMTADINDAMPTILIEAGVPSSTFSRIYKLVEKDLLPAALALRKHEEFLDGVFGHIIAGSWNADRKSEMVLKSSHLERNVDLKAMQVSMLANAVLAKYNLMSTIAVGAMPTSQAWTKYDRLRVTGLMFYKIE